MTDSRIIVGDCVEAMREMADNSVDAVVCDPPYHLTTAVKSTKDLSKVNAPAYRRMAKGFMGDQFAVSIVCRHKPGLAHLLISEDTDLAVMNCLREIQKANTGLVGVAKPPEVQPAAEPVPMSDDVRAMLTLCAQVFRSYERQHRVKAAAAILDRDVQSRIAKADRNRDIAEQVEALLSPQPGDRITVDGQPADVVAAPTDDDAAPPPLCGV